MTDKPKYFSESRGEFVEIASMETPHLARAAKKMAADLRLRAMGSEEGEQRLLHQLRGNDGPWEVLYGMIDELASRVPPKAVRS